MIISIASGKGGTGKTTVAVNLAFSLQNVQFLDCDVEEPNAHIFIKPEINNKIPVYIPVPQIEKNKCNFCGKCQEICAYKAIAVLETDVLVFPELCHGCGACSYLCPKGAIRELNREIGFVEIGRKGDLQFAHGRLNIGEALSPPLIKAVKRYANPTRTVIIDAPPGTSCPVIEAVKASDFCILVTEPTPFGLYDLTLAARMIQKLKIPFGVVINRSDLGNKKVEAYCRENNIPIFMKIPFKKKIAAAYSRGDVIIDVLPEYTKDFAALYDKVKKRLK